ncbi:MAG: NfeD family protein [Candidatus Thermoplasmatota archaeon]
MGVCSIIIIGLIILIAILYLVYLKFFSPPTPTTTSTTLKDREGYVIKEIKPENIKGKVKIIHSNKIWSATADHKIDSGTKVRVNEVGGVHLIVEEMEKEEQETENKGFSTRFRGMKNSIQDGLSSTSSFFKNKFQKKPRTSEDETLSESDEGLESEELADSLEEVIETGEEEEVSETAEEAPEEETIEQEAEVDEEVSETAEEVPEEETTEQEEVESEGVCPSCETLIPVDSKECPECGAKIKSVQEEELEKEIFELVEEE